MNDLPYDYKKIWLKRDDNTLEYKEWFIFSFQLKEELKNKINIFINNEIVRYKPDSSNIFNSINQSDYDDLSMTNPYIPPRLIKLNHQTASSFNFSLKKINNVTFDDNVGGILQDYTLINNSYLSRELINYDYVLFNPSVFAKIYYSDNNQNYYVYQLDKHNLFHKNKIFYTACGGHLKYNHSVLEKYIKRFEIVCQEKEDSMDQKDLSFLIPSKHFNEFIKMFQQDILSEQFNYFENPVIGIKRELLEELGPIKSNDGLNILEADEIFQLIKESNNLN